MMMNDGRTDETGILVVDDDENNRKYYRQVLDRNGYTADEASSGEAAVELISRNDYKLVLSDLQMYRISGLDVLKAAKEKNPHTQVVILTGYGSIPTAVKAMQKGAFDYMSKPVKKDAFLIRVDKALEQYDMQVRLQEQQAQIDAHQLMLQRDLDLAKTVQDSLIPHIVADERINIGFQYHPMIGIGGDFCSIYKDHQDHIHLNMVDVTGHGIAAALIVNRVYNELNTILKTDPMPKDVLASINDFFYNTFGSMGLFLTMMSIQLDFSTQTMYYAGGAHPPVLHYVPDKLTIRQLVSQNTIVGFEKSRRLDFQQDSSSFNPGDRILVYTDGVLEAENAAKKEFGLVGLIQSLKKHGNKSVDTACASIVKEVQSYSAGAHRDDIMLLMAEIQ